jgi:hypothetical protein
VSFTPGAAGTTYRGQLTADLFGQGTVAHAILIGTGTPSAGTFISLHKPFDCDIRSNANQEFVSGAFGYSGSLNAVLRARAANVGAWEKFRCVAAGAGEWAIKSRTNGKYVSAELGDPSYMDAALRARASSIGAWEIFTIVAVSGCSSCFALRSSANDRYVSVELGYPGVLYGLVRSRSMTIGPWEEYIITLDST